MDFSYGVKAMVTLTKEPEYSYYYGNSRDVYDKLEPYVGHYEAAEAEGWTEMACIGEIYEQDEFIIEMVEV
jgi:hypothetical protein